MSVLNAAIELYREVCKKYPKTSPAYMQLRQYITGHFGHDGTRAMESVDEERLPVSRATGIIGKRLQAFKHPNSKTAQKPQVARQLPGELDGPLNSQLNDGDAAEGDEAEIDGLPTDPANAELKVTNTADTQEAQKDDAQDANTADAQDALKLQEIDEAEIKELKAAAVTTKYTYESLSAYVFNKGHKVTGTESHKQLASIAIHFSKKA